MYYRSTVTGHIIRDTSIDVLNQIYGENGVDSAIESGIIVPIESPSVIDCIRYGTEISAVLRYYEIHKCGVHEAREGVKRIKEDMNKFKEKKTKTKNPLAVKYYRLRLDDCIGVGYYMPSKEFFEKTYVPENFPNAKNLGNGKYQIDEFRYIKCEEVSA